VVHLKGFSPKNVSSFARKALVTIPSKFDAFCIFLIIFEKYVLRSWNNVNKGLQ
jgi:hypothetical protein